MAITRRHMLAAAGATELGLDITKRYQKFPFLISIEAIPELTNIAATKAEWKIGAATTLTPSSRPGSVTATR